jgi:hypothetical protein
VELVEVGEDMSQRYHVQVSYTSWCVFLWVAKEIVARLLLDILISGRGEANKAVDCSKNNCRAEASPQVN